MPKASATRRYTVCRFEYTSRYRWRVWDLRDARWVETMRAEDGLTDFYTEGAAEVACDHLNATMAA
jgi:hypothetical protein